MSWIDTLLGGGFALAGVAFQQAATRRTDRRTYEREQRDRRWQEQHLAFVELVRAARRVQRALVDLDDETAGDAATTLSSEIDQLTATVATVRLVVTDSAVVDTAEAFEEQAKELERVASKRQEIRLQLSPLIAALQQYEQTRDDMPTARSRIRRSAAT